MKFYFDVLPLEENEKVQVRAVDKDTREIIASRTVSNYPQMILKAENEICEILEEDFEQQWELVTNRI